MQERFADKIVKIVIYLNSVFAAVIIAVYLIVRQEPEVLVGCWFGSFTMELLVLAKIRIEKVRKEGKGDGDEGA
jgi:hypothetical protein